MNKRTVMCFLVGFIICLFVLIGQAHNRYIKDFKDGRKTLECYIDNQYKAIDPDKIVDYDDESGYFIFTNGYAKNCRVY